MSWSLLKELWLNYNRLILWLAGHIPESCLANTWSVEDDARTLEWLVNDYYRHLKCHTEHFQRRVSELSG